MSDDDLNKRIAKAQAEIDARERPKYMAAGKGMGIGLRMASDFAAAVIVGVVLGLGIDAIFKVSPWGLVICLLLGFVAGVRMIIAAANKANQPAPAADGETKGEGD